MSGAPFASDTIAALLGKLVAEAAACGDVGNSTGQVRPAINAVLALHAAVQRDLDAANACLHNSTLVNVDLNQTAAALRERVKVLEDALRPFACVKPSSFYSADGSEAEKYFVILADWPREPYEFTGIDLARARRALTPATEAQETRDAHSG